jgi:hypothetical protein
MEHNGGRRGKMMTVGESGLIGWPGALGRRIARPVARRTPFTEEQVRAFIGLLLMAYAFYRIARPSIHALREQ